MFSESSAAAVAAASELTTEIVAVTNTQDGKQYTQIIIKIKWNNSPKQHRKPTKANIRDDDEKMPKDVNNSDYEQGKPNYPLFARFRVPS